MSQFSRNQKFPRQGVLGAGDDGQLRFQQVKTESEHEVPV